MDRERYGLAFMRAARYVARVYNRHLANVSLTASQHGILEAIGKHGPVSLQVLGEVMVIERSALQRTLQPLKRAKLVQSMVDPANKKRSLYELTAEGGARLESSISLIWSAEAELAEFFGRSDLAAMKESLAKSRLLLDRIAPVS
ncbi:winged helix-turn-helix transcriptional regulator [Paraburkholderia bengalensis]|uniref:Winged helix-turn-helix transcriptional regulator n=1 Tax=Paraburkholderia bengalensis TaxID=2747562 RepID=A0ABU8J1U7_9BURK